MGIGIIVVVVFAVVLIVYLVRATTTQHVQAPAGPYLATSSPPASPAETPREIVQRRYASGDIDREEYLQKLADL